MIDTRAVIARLRETDARSGGRREAWSAEWTQERERLDELAREAGEHVVVERDAFANTWYVLAGESADTVLVGSHSDCVPGGGWLDGILGVHAGLAILAAAAAADLPPERTLALVDWADEEGTRFGHSLLGSSAATGALTVAGLSALTTADGTPAPDVVGVYGFDIGRLGEPSPRLRDVVAAVELHIEQGPRLEAEGRPVAAVAGCLGVRRAAITLTGTAGHAGATAMTQRRDPVRAAAALIAELSALAEGEGGLATVGRIEAEPAMATAIAARCRLTLDLRHPNADTLARLDARARELVGASPCDAELVELHRQEPVSFDPELIEAAVAASGGGEPVTSGPLHDSVALAQAGIPAVMLFAPSIGGVSHARAEDTKESDLVLALQAFDELVAGLLRP